MKKGILKTILKDFFKLRYVVIWVILILLVGTTIVWAVNDWSSIPGGVTLFFGRSAIINDTNAILGPCIVVKNAGSLSYFIPTRTANEFTAFKTTVSAGTVPGLSWTSCPPTSCVPGEYLVGTTCTICPASYYCDGTYKTPCPTGTSSGAGQTTCTL